MSELQALYHDLIIDHGRDPRHFGEYQGPCHKADGFNPLCGDKLTVFLTLHPNTHRVEIIQFIGEGCAISIASASLMAETLQGKTIEELQEIFQLFHQQVTLEKTCTTAEATKLGKLSVLAGVRSFPSRVKCATLAWHTLQTALSQIEKRPHK